MIGIWADMVTYSEGKFKKIGDAGRRGSNGMRD
jgi:hypothetical protein